MPRKERSLMEQAYAELKRRIITLELKPGQRLDDYELSQELKFSRTPVREAIFLLGAEGWVDIRSKAGFIVRPLDLVDIAHFFEADVFTGQCVGDADPAFLPANTAVAADEPDFIVAGVFEGRELPRQCAPR